MHVDTHGMQAMQTMSTRIDPRGALDYSLIIRTCVQLVDSFGPVYYVCTARTLEACRALPASPEHLPGKLLDLAEQ